MNKHYRNIFIIMIILNIAALFAINNKKASVIKDVETYEISLNSGKIKDFKNSLPEEKEIVNLISQITKLGNDLNLSGIHYNPLVTKNGYKYLVLTFGVEGDYKRIRQFIYNIETLRKLIYIDSLSLRKSSVGNDNLAIELQVSTYFK